MIDPRSLGALCARCPLQGLPPVPGEWRPGTPVLIGEAPGEREVEKGAPFVGASGLELQRALGTLGLRRSAFSITNAILCRPPENKLGVVNLRTERERRRLKNRGAPDDALPLVPEQACRPRLVRELLAHARGARLDVVTLGGTAFRALTGSSAPVLSIRGGPREYREARVLPTLHPAFVARARRWTQAFVTDLGRAVRWFSGSLAWQDPEVIYQPSPTQVRNFLAQPTPFFAYDVETTPAFPKWGLYDPCFDRLDCIGFATADGRRAMVVPFHSREAGASEFYTDVERREIRDTIRAFLANQRILKVTWNGGYYDRMVCEQPEHFGVTPVNCLDGIGLHKFADPELPHNLGYAGSIYTDVAAWKAGKQDGDASDQALWKYNATDNAVTALTIHQLRAAVTERGQDKPAAFWPQVQDVCVGLHKNGMHVDQARRREWDSRLLAEAKHALREVRRNVEDFTFNPGSTAQVRELLFERWGLEPEVFTEQGDPSTGDAVLRSLLRKVEPPQRAALQLIRDYRYAAKLRGTYITKLRPMGEELTEPQLAWDDDETPEERAARHKREAGRPGLVLADGRVHPDYNAHGTVGWRLSSSNPNAQNFTRKIRDVITGAPGRVIVGADMDQLELRFAAALAGARLYLHAFNTGGDPHAVTCTMLYGDEFAKADPDKKKALRDFGKRFSYAVLYRAEDETVHEVITSTEDDDGKLLYAGITLREVSALRRRWLDASPEIEKWWENEIAEWHGRGYLTEPVLGQRIDFLDGERGRNVEGRIVNFRPQSGGSALVHLATVKFLAKVPFGAWGPGTGLIQQGHDALEVEVPCWHEKYDGPGQEHGYCPPKCRCEANRCASFLEECMRIDGRPFSLPVTFTASAKIRKRWHEPKAKRAIP